MMDEDVGDFVGTAAREVRGRGVEEMRYDQPRDLVLPEVKVLHSIEI